MMKHDFKVTIYLLPHILVYVLLGCNQEDRQEVRYIILFGFCLYEHLGNVVSTKKAMY